MDSTTAHRRIYDIVPRLGDPRATMETVADPQDAAPETTPLPLLRRVSRPESLELPRGALVGEYAIDAKIGEGAMGTIYSATHPMIGKRVALKVLKPELCANQTSLDRFVQEAQAVNQIGHPNIVDVFALGELPDPD